MGQGNCRYGNDEKDIIDGNVGASSLLICQQQCDTTECTAVAFTPSEMYCVTYRGGPNTYAVGGYDDTQCYVVEGIYRIFCSMVFNYFLNINNITV